MIRDPFHQELVEALNRQLDPERFEGCVADLLREEFSTLVPVPGGGDAGMDGAVADGQGTPFPLICTTGKDVTGNLRRSLRSYKKEGGQRRVAILATSRKLTPRQRRNLEKIAAEESFTLVQIYEQQAIANLLYHNPRWCRELLNLTGDPPPLSLLPCTNRPLLDYPLIAREQDLRQLREAPGDLLLVGQPGSGKTYLLYRFAQDGGGLFVASDSLGAIAGGIRAQQPPALIVDDAHTKCELLGQLRRLQREIGGSFRIIASCWPGDQDTVAAALGIATASVRELELLTRDEIVKVINAAGIYGPTPLVRELVDQAVGKPGLAVTLTHLCMRDGVRDVALGTALSRDVRLTFERLVGREAIQVLAAFAIGGNAGMPMEVVADVLRLPLTKVREVITQLAAGGIVMDQRTGLAVWPAALRHALVRDTFFAGPASLPFDGLATKAPASEDVTRTLMGARACGATVPDSSITARLERTESWHAWSEFASLGERESRWVLQHHPERLIQVAHPVLYHAPAIAIPMLLERAVGDHRALHCHTDQPFRILQDWIHAAQPGTGEALRRRRSLMVAAADWLRKGQNAEVGLVAVELAMSPNHEVHETNPGSGMVVTFTRGFITRQEIKETRNLWSQAATAMQEVAIPHWGALMRAVQRLVCPYAMNTELTNAHLREMRSVARQMVLDIAAMAHDRPGVVAWAGDMSRQLRLQISVDVPEDYLILSPVREGADWRKSQEEQAKAAKSLATRWSHEEPEAVAKRIVYLEHEAAVADVGTPRWTHLVCQEIATATSSPLYWIKCLMDCGARCELLGPFLGRALAMRSDGLTETAARCLDTPAYKPIGAEAVLAMADAPPDLLLRTLRYLPELAHLVDVWCMCGGVALQHLPHLLQHDEPRVAIAAAIGIRHAKAQPPIPDSLKELWRSAIIRCGVSGTNLHGVFDGEPDLALHWLAKRLEEQSDQLWRDSHSVEMAIAAMMRDHRQRLIDLLPNKWIPLKFLARLIRDDIGIYRHLLSRPDLTQWHLDPLEGRPEGAWVDKALAALDAGHQPDELVRTMCFQGRSWSGSEAASWQKWMDSFQPLLSHRDVRLQEVARQFIAYAERQRDSARQRERHEAIYGHE